MGNILGETPLESPKQDNSPELSDFEKKALDEAIEAHGGSIAVLFRTKLAKFNFGLRLEAYLRKEPSISLEEFLITAVKSQRTTGAIDFLFKPLELNDDRDSKGDNDNSKEGDSLLLTFLIVLLELTYTDHDHDGNDDKIISLVGRRIFDFIESTIHYESDRKKLERFQLDYAPFMGNCIVHGLYRRCFPGVKVPSRFKYTPPAPQSLTLCSPIELFPLSLFSESLQGTWTRLYTTMEDGRSFNRIVHGISGYNGPTVTLIEATDGRELFGFFASEPWRESNRSYGTGESFVYQLRPRWCLCRARPSSSGSNSSSDYQWMNLSGFDMPHGYGVGKRGQFRVFVPDSLEGDECVAKASDMIFEPGALLATTHPGTVSTGEPRRLRSGGTYQLRDLAVFGCGGDSVIEKGLKGQSDARMIREDALQKARKVDKAKFFENTFDREMFLSNTFSHQKDATSNVCP